MERRYDWVREFFASGQSEILIRNEMRNGQSDMEGLFAQIPGRLGVDTLAVSMPLLQEKRNGFTARGEVVWNGTDYSLELEGGKWDGGEKLLVSLKLRDKGADLPLDECYHLAGVRLPEDFYGVKHEDFYKGIYVVSSEIGFSCGKNESARESAASVSFHLVLKFTKDCPMWKRFEALMPEADMEVAFSGRIHPESHPVSYEVTGEYLHLVRLPYLQGSISTTRCALTIHSHTEDFYEFGYEKGYMSMAYWRGAFDLQLGSAGLPQVWLSEELYRHGQQFTLSVEFEGGLTINHVLGLISSLSGQTDMIPIPDWLSLDAVSLTALAFRLQKEVSGEAVWPANSQEQYQGVSVVMELKLPSIPIPFFDDKDEPATVSLMLQWDLLHINPLPSETLAFRSRWKGYGLNLNLDLSELSFIGRLYREEEGKSERRASSGIFPGFLSLTLTELRAAGSLTDSYYAVELMFAEPKGEKLPLAERMLDIIQIGGWGFYTPEGVGLGLDLKVVLLGAVFGVSGSYAKEGGKQVLTLQGDLYTPLRLLEFVGYLLGITVGGAEFELNITQLHLKYVTELSDGDVTLSDGNVRNFEFLAGISFVWSAAALTAKTVFSLKWDQRQAYRMSLSAQVEFFGFLAQAVCDVTAKDGSLRMEGIRFEIRMAGLDLVAMEQEAGGHKVLRLEIREINLGVLLESLVEVIIPGTSWYLPWPFGILKQLTLKNLSVLIDNTSGVVRIEYGIDLKILVFRLKSIVLEYGDGRDGREEHFTLTLDLGAASGEREASVENAEPYAMDFLKGLYPPIPHLGDSKFKLRYLAVGQRVKVEVPKTFDDAGIADVLAQLRKQIKEEGAPELEPDNNWVAALEITLLGSIDVTVLMCDPRIYGLQLEIGKGCDMTKDIAGLKLVVLYSKVTESIGMFYARLSLPEAFRRIELGALQLQLGEAAVAIYTNGDFQIDLGFPHGGDFSRSFGLTYLIFGGKGGFYLGSLHGETSARVPEAVSGHFDTVLELGVGISAGVGREFTLGPVRFGASIQVAAIFEGVIAQYVPEDKTKGDATYFKISAMAGVTAAVYGEVDFVVLKVSFSVNLSVTADLTIESYRQTLLELKVQAAVKASIKILFIKINFSFDFKWNPVFILGENSVAPWERAIKAVEIKDTEYTLDFRAVRVYEQPREIEAMLTPYGAADNVCLNGISEGEALYRVTMLPLLCGFQDGTANRLHYRCGGDTPVGVLAEAMLRRCLKALGIGDDIPYEALEWLAEELAKPEVFEEGFGWEALEEFLADNLHVRFLSWERKDTNEEEHRVPFPIPPLMAVRWQDADDSAKQYDLSKEPLLTEGMLERMEEYYSMLRPKETGLMENLARNREDGRPMAEWLFRDYFYMFSKVVVAQALQYFPEGEDVVPVSVLAERILQSEALDSVCGFVSRSVLGGMRFAYDSGGRMETESLFTYAGQQYDVQGGFGIHKEVREVVYEAWKSKEDEWFHMDNIEMHLTQEDIVFPPEHMEVKTDCRVLPFYRTKYRILELKDATEIEGLPLRRIFSVNGTLPSPYRIVVLDGDKELPIKGTVKPCLKLRIPLTRAAKDTFSVGCLGYEAVRLLDSLDFEQVEKTECYRTANAPGERGNGLKAIDGEIFMYRQNLSTEAEKPMVMSLSDESRNSAYLAGQQKMFLSLLRDASRVNSRGYFLSCTIPEEAVQEGFTELLFLLFYHGETDSIVLDYEDSRMMALRPVVMTEETYESPVYRPGHTGISLEPENSEAFLTQPFQLLRSRVESAKERKRQNGTCILPVKDGKGFSPSTDSLPVTPLTEGEQARFTQILPLYRCFTDDEDPYGGIVDYQSCRIRFALLDVTGNETTEGLDMDVEMGYTDPLTPPAAYPATRLGYDIFNQGEKLEVRVTIACNRPEEGLKEEEIRLARTAYFQLLQKDVRLALEVMGNRAWQDKEGLLAYLDVLRRGSMPEQGVVFVMSVPRPTEDLLRVDVCLVIERDDSCLSSLIESESARRAVCGAKAAIPPKEDGIRDVQIARLGGTGELYHLHLPEWEIEDKVIAYALAPLSKSLISLSELSVYTLSGETASVSYSDIDLEEWADIFFQDFERIIGPDSMLELKQEELEELLEMKGEFAQKVSRQLEAVETGEQDDQRREAAVRFLAEQLKQNLYLARYTDVIAVYGTTAALKKNQAYIGVLQEGFKGVNASLGKIREDGLLALALRCDDRKRQRRVTGELGLQVTEMEWETKQGKMPEYYSYLVPQTKRIKVNAPIPDRHFPPLPGLMEHEAFPSRELLEWDYRFCFSHKTAAQDAVSVEIQFGETGKNRMGFTLPEALGQYMFLREDILNGKEGAVQGMLIAGRRVLNSWGVDERKTASGFGNKVLRFDMSVDPENRQLILDSISMGDEKGTENGTKEQERRNRNIEVEMQLDNGEWGVLKGDGNRYEIPEDAASLPYLYRFTLRGLSLAQVYQVNTEVWVTRNQTIPNIAPNFLLTTKHVQFPSALKPVIVREQRVERGGWDENHFVEGISELCRGFGSAAVELSFGRRLAEEPELYLWLPILYLPDISQEALDEDLRSGYQEIDKWTGENINEKVLKDGVVRVRLSLCDVSDRTYCKADLKELIFRIQKRNRSC